MSTIFVDNIKTVSGTDTFTDGQYRGVINASATGTFAGTTTGTHSGASTGTHSGTISSSATFPSHHIIQISEGVTTAQDNQTNGNLSFLQHSITRTNNANKILIFVICCWGGDNPNGHLQLRRSYDDSTYTKITTIGGLDGAPHSGAYDMEVTPFLFLDTPSSSYSQVYYEIFWYHKIQNGGTMYRNRPHTIDAGETVGISAGYSAADGARTSLTLMEVVT